MNLAALLQSPPMPRSELAARAGISRNTEWGVRKDQSRARVDTLREIALACGYDLEIVVRAPYDPVATAAARRMVGDLATEDLTAASIALMGSQPDWSTIDQWRERIERYVDLDAGAEQRAGDPITIATEAARFAAPQAAPEAVMLAGRDDVVRLTSAAIATTTLSAPDAATAERPSHRWAFSGWPALEALGASPTPGNPQFPYPDAGHLITVVWTTMPHQLGQFLGDTHRKVSTIRAANVIVAPLQAHHLVGMGGADGIPFVSPVQAVIDSFGVGGDLAAVAQDLARGW